MAAALSRILGKLTEESGSFRGVDLLPGWFVTNIEEEENSESSRKKKSKNCHGLPGSLLYNTESYLDPGKI